MGEGSNLCLLKKAQKLPSDSVLTNTFLGVVEGVLGMQRCLKREGYHQAAHDLAGGGRLGHSQGQQSSGHWDRCEYETAVPAPLRLCCGTWQTMPPAAGFHVTVNASLIPECPWRFLVPLLGQICKAVKQEEKAMATHSSTLAWKIAWTEEPGRLQFKGSLRVAYD